MKFLAASWRWPFISGSVKAKGCIFCRAAGDREDGSLVCHRDRSFFVMLNKYPYSTGHVMIAPLAHCASPELLPPGELGEMTGLLLRTLEILRRELRPAGFNVGMNLGEAAGAGVVDHFHLHVVPRWPGDANFMATVADTKVLSYDLGQVRETLSRAFRS